MVCVTIQNNLLKVEPEQISYILLPNVSKEKIENIWVLLKMVNRDLWSVRGFHCQMFIFSHWTNSGNNYF